MSSSFLQLLVEIAPGFKVLRGNEQSMVPEGKISQLSVDIQGNLLVVPVCLLPFLGVYLILGSSWLAWLATIGLHIESYSNLSLKFSHRVNLSPYRA